MKLSIYKKLYRRITSKLSMAGLVFSFTTLSCNKFVEIDPPVTSLTASTVFANDATATAAIMGVYEKMMESYSYLASGPESISLLCGMSSDEMVSHFSEQGKMDFYNNSLIQDNNFILLLWGELYKHIYTANAIIEGVTKSEGLSAATKDQLTGEALFLRSFFSFYLTNLFGDIPLATGTDYTTNRLLPRTEKKLVYQQIIDDLKTAQEKMSSDYSLTTGNLRIRPNKWVASALLARVYLYTGDWANAETESTKLIDNQLFFLQDNLNDVFLKTSSEAIWQIPPVVAGWGVYDAYFFSFSSTPTGASLSDGLISSFEPGDNRKDSWVNEVTTTDGVFYHPLKYKVGFTMTPDEFLTIMRLSEQYLIRAEARIHQPGKLAEGIGDINSVRDRARQSPTIEIPDPLPSLGSNLTEDEALAAVAHERYVELFSEWGHRWFDLIRTNKADIVLQAVKGSTWSANDTLYPLPVQEMSRNPNLIPQNKDY